MSKVNGVEPAAQEKRERKDQSIIIRLDGVMYQRGAQTSDPERARLMREWIQDMKRGEFGGLETLRHNVEKRIPLGEAYDRRADPKKVLAMQPKVDIEPLVDEWHAWLSDEKADRKGRKSADKYREQVRSWIEPGKAFNMSRFTSALLYAHLNSLKVSDVTRSKYRAAFSSFAEYLHLKQLVQRNPVRDLPRKGFRQSSKRCTFILPEQAKHVHDCLTGGNKDVIEKRAAYALAVGAAAERQTLQKLRVRDVTITREHGKEVRCVVFLDGEKVDGSRSRFVRVVPSVRRGGKKVALFDWCIESIEAAIADKLPDAFVCRDVVLNDHCMLEAIESASVAAKVQRTTLHDCRHTHAVAMLRAGFPETTVARHLGHSDTNLLRTTYGNYVKYVDDRDYMVAGAVDIEELERLEAEVVTKSPETFQSDAACEAETGIKLAK